MKEHPFMHLPATVHGVPFLSGLDEPTLEAVLRGSTLLEFEPGETIITEGDEGEEFYVLLRGHVDIVKAGTKVGEIEGRGQTVGELTLLNHEPRAASVVAAEKAFCLRIDRATLDGLEGEQKIAYQAALYRFLAEVLIERLRATNERVVKLEAELVLG